MSEIAMDSLLPQNPTGGVRGSIPDVPNSPDNPAGDYARAMPALSIRVLALPLAFLAMFAFFARRAPQFLSFRNLSMLMVELSITAVLALGMLLVILPGQIDLAAGSGVGLFGGVAAVLIFEAHWPAWSALLVATVAAILTWLILGTIIVWERVPAFIITLGGLLLFRGLHWKVIHNSAIPVSPGSELNLYARLNAYNLSSSAGLALGAIVIILLAAAAFLGYRRARASGEPIDGQLVFMRTFLLAQLVALLVLVCNGYQGIPAPALILGAVALVVWFLCKQTPFGRYLYAIGGNEEAALLSGVPVAAVTIGAFAIMGFIVAITGFMQTAYTGFSTTTVGQQMELDAVAACVIGGASLKGGVGTVGGVMMGALIMATLLNGMSLLNVEPEAKYIARGIVLALAVWADVRLSRR